MSLSYFGLGRAKVCIFGSDVLKCMRVIIFFGSDVRKYMSAVTFLGSDVRKCMSVVTFSARTCESV